MDLVTGATGYVGGRLAPLLLEAGRPVRVMVRDPARHLYWSLLYPFHALIFRNLVRRVAARATALERSSPGAGAPA